MPVRGAGAPSPGRAAGAPISADERAHGGEAVPGADRLRAAARRLSEAAAAPAGASSSGLAAVVQDVLDLLVREAIPRLHAEQEVLHPILERALGRPDATTPLAVENAEIRMQTERLGSLAQRAGGAPPGRSERRAVERILKDLSRLLLGHLDREAALCTEARAAEPELDAGWEGLARALEEAERRALGAIVFVVQPVVGSQAAVVMRHNPAANRAYVATLADLTQDRDPRTGSGVSVPGRFLRG